MHHPGTMRRARVRRAGLLAAPLALAVGVVAAVGMGAGPASAGPIRDQSPASAAALADRIIKDDATLRAGRLKLPAAEAAVTSTAAAAAAAREEQSRVAVAGPSAPSAGTGDVVDNATAAILDDLAPEDASAEVVQADAAAAQAVQNRDLVKLSLANAVKDRAAAVAALAQSGQHRTWWCVSLLDRLGAPVTSENLRGLFAWIGAESNAASLLNPLATTEDAPGARNANSVGVKGYPNDEIGLDATVRTLHNGHYPGILAALARGNSALAVTNAVAASPWGTGINATRRLLSGG